MTSFGIDFGTCTTTIATTRGGRTLLLSDSAQKDVVPSIVAHTPSGRTEVGTPAKARRMIDPANTIHSMKRLVGRSWTAPETVEFRMRYPFTMEAGNDAQPRFVTRQGKFLPGELATQFMSTLRGLGSITPDRSDKTCVTVPVSFSEGQRAAIVEAVQNAGFQHVSMLEEPVAAALAYWAEQRSERKEPSRIAVYDLGGGTFDFAVLESSNSDTKVLAAGGDPYLGGDDIDHRLAQWATQKILEDFQWDVRSNAQCYAALVQACERAKIRLSEVDETVIALGQVDPVLEGKQLLIMRRQLESLIFELVQRTFITVDGVMRDSGLRVGELDTVVLAGGSSYIPSVRSHVQRYFGVTPRMDHPSDRIVAVGALKYAEAL